MQRTFFSHFVLFSTLSICAFSLNAVVDPNTPVKKDAKTMESRKAVTAKIGVVDIRRIVTRDPELLKNASDEWKELFNGIQQVLTPAQKEISQLEERYRKKAAELESLQKSGVSSKEMIRKKYEEELAPLEFQLQNQYQQYERFSYDELAKAQAVLAPKIETVIDEICDLQGWDFAIQREIIPTRRLNAKFDITDDVLSKLNKKYAAEKAAKAKAQPKKPGG